MPSKAPSAAASRYVVGFDLGTTNSAATYVDMAEEPWRVRTFAVPQVVAPGQVEARETLPSFHYQAAVGEFAPDALRCPWHREKTGTGTSPAGSEPVPVFSVGFFARDQGTLVPGRLINSAKSWLCHTGVDRTAALLPWHGAADVGRLSPIDVSARYLAHMREAWDHRFPRHPLAGQDFVLTLPASFDEVARELTVKAAALAGLPRVVLIEEPQAAFYAWIYAHADDWEQHVSPGQKILVCDIGGGTSDFTLIRVRRGEGGKVQFHRVAVGDHLILGGDNLDLALAKHIEQRIFHGGPSPLPSPGGRGDKLEPRQWAVLVRTCRAVKETLLGRDAPERLTVALPGSGSRLMGAGVQVEVTRDEVCELLVDGFFPRVGLDEKPTSRRSGFQEFGLPFAPDAAVTRYLAAFLTAHRHVAMEEGEEVDHDPARPDIVLFNGGVFESPLLRERMLAVLESWFGGWRPLVLDNDRLDLAVARGAAYYGMVRRGQGVRIAAGLARTYYIGVETTTQPSPWPSPGGIGDDVEPSALVPPPSPLAPPPSSFAVCLLPAGIEAGQDVELAGRRFDLLVSEPAEFPLFVSSTRLTDKPGEVVAVDRERMTSLPPMRTVLREKKGTGSFCRNGPKGAAHRRCLSPFSPAADSVSVALHARLTEIGTLDLWLSELDGRRSWRLQFDVRSATQTDVAAHESQAEGEGVVAEEIWQPCQTLIQNTFGTEEKKGTGPICAQHPSGRSGKLDQSPFSPEGLVKRLVAATGMGRGAWPTSLCRRIWQALVEVEPGRRRSAVYEARWLNLLGFALRPGYGLAVDDWRAAQTWNMLQGKFVHSAANVRVEGWILWRRIGGGLAAGQQQALAEPLVASVRGLHRQLTTGKGRSDFSFATHETAEMWRLLGSLELLPAATKVELGGMLLDLLPKRKMEPVRGPMLWAVGRLGARVPMYGPLNTVVPAAAAGQWLVKLMPMGARGEGKGGSRETAKGEGRRGKGEGRGEKGEGHLAAGAQDLRPKTQDPTVGDCQLAVMQLARRTDDRYRDLSEKLRREAADWLAAEGSPRHFIELVRDGGSLDSEEQGLVFGESLPKGLRLA
jgi:molecular chaperone DnaK (HSP70)